jgi:hypothetical protein
MKHTSESRKTANLSESLHQQLNMYALAASAAGVSVLALAQPAEAKIVYTNAHVTLQNPASFAPDLNHDGIIDFYLDLHRAIRGRSHSASFLSICHRLSFSNCESFNSSTAPNALNAIEIVANRYYRFKATALHAGAEIQSKARFRNKKAVLMGAGEFYATSQGRTSTQWIAPWVNGGKGVKNRYLGLKFKIKGKFHFGWARLTVTTEKNGFTAALTGYAYETIPGKAIVAGATEGADDTDKNIEQSNPAALTVPTPEPAVLGALAMGAPGLSIWRRKESIAVTPEPN